MKLQPSDRDYYVVSYTTDPALSGIVQASFDGGDTWHDGTPSGSNWAWLVAGPDFSGTAVGMDDADTVATIPRTMKPLLRLKDDPVVQDEVGPQISVTT